MPGVEHVRSMTVSVLHELAHARHYLVIVDHDCFLDYNYSFLFPSKAHASMWFCYPHTPMACIYIQILSICTRVSASSRVHFKVSPPTCRLGKIALALLRFVKMSDDW